MSSGSDNKYITRSKSEKSEKQKSDIIKIEKIETEESETVKMDYVKKVNNLVLDGNLNENWRRFKRNFDIFMVAAGVNKKPDEVKIATFLNAIGEDAVDVYHTFKFDNEEDAKSYDKVIKAFQDFCSPKTNEVYERFVFNKRVQQQNEPFDVFLMDIKRLVKTCGYAEQEEVMLRDRIVLGVSEPKLQEQLLQVDQLDYKKAVDKCRSWCATKEQSTNIQKASSSATVHEISNKRFIDYKRKVSNTNNIKNQRNSFNKNTYAKAMSGIR